MRHCLKIWPEFFCSIIDRSKMFEIRKYDRPYDVGDILELNECDPLLREPTGRACCRRVTYIMKDFPGIESGYCVISLEPMKNIDTTEPVLCPFCGGYPSLGYNGKPASSAFVYCQKSKAKGPETCAGMSGSGIVTNETAFWKSAVIAWNNRFDTVAK